MRPGSTASSAAGAATSGTMSVTAESAGAGTVSPDGGFAVSTYAAPATAAPPETSTLMIGVCTATVAPTSASSSLTVPA